MYKIASATQLSTDIFHFFLEGQNRHGCHDSIIILTANRSGLFTLSLIKLPHQGAFEAIKV